MPVADTDLRSVSLGLLRGAFPSVPRPPTGSDVAAAAEPSQDLAATEPDPGRGGQTAAATLSSPDVEANERGLPASSSLGGLSGSSWSGRSSVRYHREIARIGAQVADALDHAHKRGVIHRDIKPHNILLDALGNAWITDFGLAKLKQGEGQDAESTAQAFAGTLRFMAPERFQGKSDGRDDIYALGATLYEFLALRPIFEDSDPHQLLSQIEHDPPTPLRQIDRQIHPDLAAIIARTLAKDPADRYATAAELRDELRRFIEGRPVKTRPVPSYARFWRWCKRNPWLAGANIAAAVTTTVLAIGSTIAAKVYYDKSEQIAEQAKKPEAIGHRYAREALRVPGRAGPCRPVQPASRSAVRLAGRSRQGGEDRARAGISSGTVRSAPRRGDRLHGAAGHEAGRPVDPHA